MHHLKGKKLTDERKKKISEGVKRYWSTAIRPYKPPKERMLRRTVTDEEKAAFAERSKKMWEDPEIRKRMIPQPGKHPYKNNYPITKEEWERNKNNS